MIDLTVVGGGESFGKYVAPSVYRTDPEIHPELDMRVHTLIDIVPRSALYPTTRNILDVYGINYMQVAPRQNLVGVFSLPPNPAAIVATPNDSHFFWGEMLTRMGVPTLVEKPPVCSFSDLEKFERFGAERSGLWYNAESNSDGKALGLLFLLGKIGEDDPRRNHLRFVPDNLDSNTLSEIIQNLGSVVRIEGRMLEGTGSAGTADHRRWLLDGSQGGMIRDLASHLLTPLFDGGIIAGGGVAQPKVTLGVYESGMELCRFRQIQSSGEGETYAKIVGFFETISGGKIPFVFQVAKYWNTHDRFLEIVFEKGRIRMGYEKPYETTIRNQSGGLLAAAAPAVWPYSLCLMDFQGFVRGEHARSHFDRAMAIALFNETTREVGLQEAEVAA